MDAEQEQAPPVPPPPPAPSAPPVPTQVEVPPDVEQADDIASTLRPVFEAKNKSDDATLTANYLRENGMKVPSDDPRGTAASEAVDAERGDRPADDLPAPRINEGDDSDWTPAYDPNAIVGNPSVGVTASEAGDRATHNYMSEIAGQGTIGVAFDVINVAHDGLAYFAKLTAKPISPATKASAWAETFGTTENNLVYYPKSENLAPQMARMLPEWMMVAAAVNKIGFGRFASLTGIGAGLDLGPNAPMGMKFLNSTVFNNAVPGAIADALISSQGENMSAVVKEMYGDEGTGIKALDAITDFMASDPNDPNTVNALRSSLEGFVVNTALHLVPKFLHVPGWALDTFKGTKAGQWVTDGLVSFLQSARDFRAIKAQKPQLANAITSATEQMGQAARSERTPISGLIDPPDRLYEGEPGAAPGDPYIENSHGILEKPADKPLVDVMRNEDVTATGDRSAEWQQAERELTAKATTVAEKRGALEQAYHAGDIKSGSVLFRQYSRQFWHSAKAAAEAAGAPLDKKQLRLLKRYYDNVAMHWSSAMDQPGELFYRELDPVQVAHSIQDIPHGALRQTLKESRVFYHGSTTRGLSIFDFDPKLTRAQNLKGRALYAAENVPAQAPYPSGEHIAGVYARRGSDGTVYRFTVPEGTKVIPLDESMKFGEIPSSGTPSLDPMNEQEHADALRALRAAAETMDNLPAIAGVQNAVDALDAAIDAGADFTEGVHALQDTARARAEAESGGKLALQGTADIMDKAVFRPLREHGYDAYLTDSIHDNVPVLVAFDPADTMGIGRTLTGDKDWHEIARPGQGTREGMIFGSTNTQPTQIWEEIKRAFTGGSPESNARDLAGQLARNLVAESEDRVRVTTVKPLIGKWGITQEHAFAIHLEFADDMSDEEAKSWTAYVAAHIGEKNGQQAMLPLVIDRDAMPVIGTDGVLVRVENMPGGGMTPDQTLAELDAAGIENANFDAEGNLVVYASPETSDGVIKQMEQWSESHGDTVLYLQKASGLTGPNGELRAASYADTIKQHLEGRTAGPGPAAGAVDTTGAGALGEAGVGAAGETTPGAGVAPGTETLLQGGTATPKGAYFRDPTTNNAVIALFAGKADYSTFLHESAHLFYDTVIPIMDDVPRNALYDWAGAPRGVPWQQWPEAAKEKFAQAFERVALEGKAPTAALQPIFSEQAKWMRQIYGGMTAPEVVSNLPPEVQGFVNKVLVGPAALPQRFAFTHDPNTSDTWINHDRILRVEDIEGMQQHYADADVNMVDTAYGKKQTLNDVVEGAKKLNISVQEYLGMSPYMTEKQAFYGRQLEVASAKTLFRLADAARHSSDPMLLSSFRRAITVHRAINVKNRGMSRIASRILGSRRAMAGSTKETLKRVEEMVQNEGAENLRDLADMVSTLGKENPDGLNGFVRDLDKATKWDALHEVFINNLLSGPKTHLVNALGNSGTIALSMVHTVAAATMNEAWNGGKEIGFQDVAEMMNGILRGTTEGWRLAKLAFDDNAIFDAAKGVTETAGAGATVRPHAFSAATFGRESVESFGDDPIAWGIDGLGKTLRIPTRALKSSDAFFYTVNYRMELHRLAHRDALGAFNRANGAMTAEEMGKRLTDTLANPPDAVRDKAVKFAKKQTFTSDLTGRASKWTARAAGTPYWRKVFPFMKTPLNLFKYGFENTPLAPLSRDFRERLSSKDAGEAAIARAQWGIATIAFFAIGDAVDKGYITGGYSLQPGEKASQQRTDMTRYTIGASINSPRISYNRLDPMGMSVGMMTDVWQAIDKASDGMSEELAVASILHLADSITSKTYMKSFSDIIEALNTGSYDRIVPTIAGQVAAHAAPLPLYSLASQLEGALDPVLRDAKVTGEEDYAAGMRKEIGQGGAQVVYRLINEIVSRVPGMSEELPASHDLWGREISMASPLHDYWWGKAYEFMSPISITRAPDAKTAEIEQIMQRNRYFPENPERQIDGIKLTAREYENYAKESGRAALRALKQQLPYLRSLPDDGAEGEKVQAIKDAIGDARFTVQQRLRETFPQPRVNIADQRRKAVAGKTSWGFSASAVQALKVPGK